MSTLFDQNDNVDDNDQDQDSDVNYLEVVAAALGKQPSELTVEDLAKKAFHADRHINRLENETEVMRSEIGTKTTLEKLMEEIRTLKQPTETSREVNKPIESSNNVEGLKEEDVVRLLQQERVKATHDHNITQVRKDLESAWGRNYRTKLKEVGTELGLTEEELGSMAATKPKAFMKLVGADVVHGGPTPHSVLSPSSSIRPTTKQTPERTYAYYKKLHKENPTLYWDPKTRQQMYADLEKYGPESFLK